MWAMSETNPWSVRQKGNFMEVKECKPNQSFGLLAGHTAKGWDMLYPRMWSDSWWWGTFEAVGQWTFSSMSLTPDTFQAARVVPDKIITFTKKHWVIPCTTLIQGVSHSFLSDILFLLTSGAQWRSALKGYQSTDFEARDFGNIS